jgi:NitT/TauT family transport system ATP-binding protein/nitrate/nitrite transport system substrate-binding protein
MTRLIRLGVLRLSDSAPAVLAAAEGLFAAEGLDVELCIEPSWANIADKLAWNGLEAAIIVVPLALAMNAGLRPPRTDLSIPLVTSRGGNTIVVRADAFADKSGSGFAAWAKAQAAPPRLAVVHALSTHNLLLRHWLMSAGLDPERDVEIVVVPPERVVPTLAGSEIAGFCAGAPWGDAAEAAGVGTILLGTSSVLPGHAEKCLAVRRIGEEQALARAIQRACELCQDPGRAKQVAGLLTDRLALPENTVCAALPGGPGLERIAFSGQAFDLVRDGGWYQHEMARWGWVTG